MNTFTKLSIASALMLSAAFGVAAAQQTNETPPTPGVEQADDDMGEGMDQRMGEGRGMGHHGGKHHGGKHGRGRGMQMIDVNNDGVIGEDEAAALADRAFMRMDDDRDGKVTEAEFISGPRGKRGGWFNWNSDEKAAVEKVRKDKFTSLDANKDGSLDKTEFFVEAKAKLAAADTDKDGKVSPWEFRATR